jgi:hypothetical protein
VRPGDAADELCLDAEVTERLEQVLCHLLLAGGVGLGGLSRRAHEEPA